MKGGLQPDPFGHVSQVVAQLPKDCLPCEKFHNPFWSIIVNFGCTEVFCHLTSLLAFSLSQILTSYDI